MDNVNNEYNPEKMLGEVNNALSAIFNGGQSYTIGSRSLTRADLSKLYEIRNNLMAEVQSMQTSGLMDDTYVAYFGGR